MAVMMMMMMMMKTTIIIPKYLYLLVLVLAVMCTSTSPASFSPSRLTDTGSCFDATTRAKIKTKTPLAEPGSRGVTLEIEHVESLTTHTLGANVANLLLTELMGFEVILKATPRMDGSLSRLANNLVEINLEVWEGERTSPEYAHWVLEKEKVRDMDQLGTVARYGWYIPGPFLEEAQHLYYVDFWRSYADDDLAVAYFVNRSETYMPENATSFIPEWCLPHYMDQCVQMLAVGPESVAPQIIRRRKMKIYVTYVSEAQLHAEFRRQQPANAIMIEWYHPSTLVVDTSPRRVALPEFTFECYRNNTRDPHGYGSVDCDYPSIILKKFVASALEDDIRGSKDNEILDQERINDYNDVLNYVKQHSIDDKEQTTLLGYYTQYQEKSAYEIACMWLKQDLSYWSAWIRNSPRFEVFVLDHGTVITLRIILLVMTFFTLLMQIALFINRTHPRIRASLHSFLHFMLIGSYMGFTSIFFLSLGEDQPINCVVTTVSFGMCFALIVGAISLKNYRVHRIFNGDATNPPPSFLWMVSAQAIVVIAQLLLDLLLFTIDPPKRMRRLHGADQQQAVYECSYNWEKLRLIVLCTPKAILLLFSLYVAFKVRNFHHNFNESGKLSLASYNICILAVFVLLLNSTPNDVDKNTMFLLHSLALLIAVFPSVTAFVFMKLWAIYFGPPLSFYLRAEATERSRQLKWKSKSTRPAAVEDEEAEGDLSVNRRERERERAASPKGQDSVQHGAMRQVLAVDKPDDAPGLYNELGSN